MEQDNKFNNGVYSKRVRAGKRRTYFFDVRTTRGNDYFLTITESKRRFDDNGYERHKLHIYKEDFNKFLAALQETLDHVKTELLPDYDFDMYSRDYDDDNYAGNQNQGETASDDEEEEEEEAGEEEEEEEEEDLSWD